MPFLKAVVTGTRDFPGCQQCISQEVLTFWLPVEGRKKGNPVNFPSVFICSRQPVMPAVEALTLDSPPLRDTGTFPFPSNRYEVLGFTCFTCLAESVWVRYWSE